MSAPLRGFSNLLGLCPFSCDPQWRMCCQISHGTGGEHAQFQCLILGSLTLCGRGVVQDRHSFLPLVPIWVSLPDLPAVGIIGQRQAAPSVIVCRNLCNSTSENFYSVVFLSSSIFSMFYLWHVNLKYRVNSMLLKNSGHSMVAWRRRVRLLRVNFLILQSAIMFWW